MSKFVRKLSKQSVWKKDLLSTDPDKILETLPADVFSKCMNTDGNALSVWEIEGDKWSDFEDVVAAIISGSDGPSTTDFVILDEDFISSFKMDNEPGCLTAAKGMNEKHANIIELTHSSVGDLAKHIGLLLAQDNKFEVENKATPKPKPKPSDWNVKRFKEKELISIMKKAIEKGCINQNELKERWREKVR